MARSSYLFTSESVSEGHPDKVADRISDTVIDAFLAADPYARGASNYFANLPLNEMKSAVVDLDRTDPVGWAPAAPRTLRRATRRTGGLRRQPVVLAAIVVAAPRRA